MVYSGDVRSGFSPGCARWLLLVQTLSAVTLAQTESATPPPAGNDSATAEGAEPPAEAGRRHFRNGVKLYQDGNYAGALAEFQAAYAAKPSAASLQNLALAQKALFRYVEASRSLEQLLERHSSELQEGEHDAIREALNELRSLVGSVELRVTPPDARVTLDGRVLTEEQRRAGALQLDVGEHTLVVEAPGYARRADTLRVTSSPEPTVVSVQLQPTAGFLEVRASAPGAAIAIDGKPVGFGHYRGPASPGSHLIQVYGDGYETFSTRVDVALGNTERVAAELRPASIPDTGQRPSGADRTERSRRGWYGLLALGSSSLGQVPVGLDDDSSAPNAGGLLGLRGGYQLSPRWAGDLSLEGSAHRGDLCPEAGAARWQAAVRCGGGAEAAEYELRATRFGANGRFTSQGERLRFVSSLGLGVVHHVFATHLPDAGEVRWSGADGYLFVEAGGQLNLGHVLLELALTATFDGAETLRVGDTRDRVYDSGLAMVGATLRGGFSQWRPK